MLAALGFYDRLKARRGDDAQLEACIQRVVAQLGSEATDPRKPGMLLGKIQSGKTRAFLGITALAFDKGFDVAVVLTKGTKTLAGQTVSRIAADFKDFRDEELFDVFDILNLPNLTSWEIEHKKLIFVAKKEVNNMRRLLALFRDTHPMLAGKRVLIIDDEADLASVRFIKKKGSPDLEQGPIAEFIDELRRELSRAAFLQVTATPYSLYLQPEEYPGSLGTKCIFEPKRPAFTELLPIHSAYIGGDHYFGQHDLTEPEHYLWNKVESDEILALHKKDRRRVKTRDSLTNTTLSVLRNALVTFVAAACVRRWQQKHADEAPSNYALIVHVETSRNSHAWQHTVLSEIIVAMKEAIAVRDAIAESLIHEAIKNLSPSLKAAGTQIPQWDTILQDVQDAFLQNGIVTEKVNSDSDVMALLDDNAELRLRTPFNVFIGGQILDRGITVPNLIGFYYGRCPKRMQQDTVLQHSRMYGARPRADLAVTRFYTTAANYETLKRIHEFDSALRHAFESGAHDRGVAFIRTDSCNRVIPCAPSKLRLSEVVTLRPGGRLLPSGFQSRAGATAAKKIAVIDKRLAAYNREPVKVAIEDIASIVDLIKATLEFGEGSSFEWKDFHAAFQYFSHNTAPNRDRGKAWLLVRKGRLTSRIRESGRFSDVPESPDEAKIAKVQGLPFCLFLRQEGQRVDGWGGSPFWWPVLYAPSDATTVVFARSASNRREQL